MHSLLTLLAAEATTNPAETWYSPGVIGFIATFGVTAAAVALIFDMVRRVRRVRYRAEIEAKLDAENLESEVATPKSSGDAKPAAKATSTKSTAAKVAAPKAPAARAKPARPAPPQKPSRD